MLLVNILCICIDCSVLGATYGSNMKYCNKQIRFTCIDKRFVIKDLKANNSLEKKILRCNGLEQCDVANPEGLCVEMDYWCMPSKQSQIYFFFEIVLNLIIF